MQILLVNKYFYRRAGAEAYFMDLMESLQEHGHEIIPFSVHHDSNYSHEYSKYFMEKVHYDLEDSLYWKVRHGLRIIYSRHARKRLSMLLENTSPEIAHLQNIYHQISPSILPVLKKNGIPIVMTLHDLKLVCPNYKMLSQGKICERCKPRKYYHAVLRLCVKNSYQASMLFAVEMYIHHYSKLYEKHIDKFITPSRFYKKKMAEFGIPEEKLVYIPNFISVDQFVPDFNHEDYFVYFGRLSEEKGLMTLLKAMRKVRKGTLYIVGDGPLYDLLEQYISQYRMDNVRLTGPKQGRDLAEVVRRAKFTVLPSEWYENGSIALMESYAYGKPMIGSNIGGIPEMIEDGQTGLLFEPSNDDDLADKINFLFGHKNSAATMGKKARDKVERDYNAKLHYDRLSRCYSETLRK